MQELAFDLAPRQCLVTLTESNGHGEKVDKKYILRESAEGVISEGMNQRYSKARVDERGRILGWNDVTSDDIIVLGGSLFTTGPGPGPHAIHDKDGNSYIAVEAVGPDFARKLPDRVFKALSRKLDEFNENNLNLKAPHDPKAAPEPTTATSSSPTS